MVSRSKIAARWPLRLGISMPFTAPLKKSTPGCPVGLLKFDNDNPRLEDGRDRPPHDDTAMIKSLRDVAALGELVQSICANGYKDIEPLIVKGPEEGPFTVLEGNRRLASIRLIKNPELAQACGVALPDPIDPTVIASIETVTVYRVASKEEARAYIGFKHINGPHRWESYAKANFVTEWFKTGRAQGITIDQIADQLGDDNKTIRNMIAGMLVLEQAISAGFSISNRANKGRFAFSHLYTALTRNEYQDFLGLQKGWSDNPTDVPIDLGHMPQLQELMVWLFGAKDQQKPALIASQNPDLAVLGQVLKHPVAMRVIRAGKSLEEAKREMRPVGSVLSDVMVDISHKLREAVALAGRAQDVDASMRELAKSILQQAKSLSLLVAQEDPLVPAKRRTRAEN
jgi:hypothetical protein